MRLLLLLQLVLRLLLLLLLLHLLLVVAVVVVVVVQQEASISEIIRRMKTALVYLSRLCMSQGVRAWGFARSCWQSSGSGSRRRAVALEKPQDSNTDPPRFRV